MRFKQIATVMMGTVLMFGSLPFPAFAKDNDSEDTQTGKYSTKDEAIYGNLGADGTLEDMYVVNTFRISKPGVITDHGDYTNVRNLSNLLEIKQTDDNNVHFQAEKGEDDFDYQGDLKDKPLPWDIDITYKLDDKEVDPDELAGKSGSLELQIETSGNDDADPAFFENYMMQISLTLDPVNFDDIQAPDGTKAKSGKDTQVTFTVMPEKEESFIVSADVTDFKMDPIDISATPASMPMDDPDLGNVKGDMQSLSDGIKEIDDGVGDLNSGISEMNNGASDLSNGSSSYLNGINQLDQSSGELVNGSAEINNVLQQVSDAVQGAPEDAPDFSELGQVPEGIRALAGGLEEAASGLDELHDNYDAAYSNMDGAMNEIPDYDITEDQIEELLESDIDQEVAGQLIETYEAARNAKGTYESVQEAFGAVTGTLDDVANSVREMADQTQSTAAEIENGLDDIDGLGEMEELQSGLSDLASQYQSFHQGLIDYTDGVSALASNYQDINEGIQGLADGTASLADGAGDLKNGTEELEGKTSDLPGEMQSEVDEMIDEYDASDFEPKSFVSDKNKNVELVQFALQTESIEVEEPEDKEEAQDEEKGFWERFMDLFR